MRSRDRGTPQGSAVSPVLANLFMHYAFDMRIDREFPAVTFERYADDAVVHCVTQRQAREVLAALEDRMAQVGLELHPDKTRIVYCQDGKRRSSFEHTSFTFLGFTFRRREARGPNGNRFWTFLPAISRGALKKIGREIRRWRMHRWIGLTITEIARAINPIVAGWMHYYGRFYRSEMHPLLTRINSYLVRWIRNKYKRLRAIKKAVRAMREATKSYPAMFRHWKWTIATSLT